MRLQPCGDPANRDGGYHQYPPTGAKYGHAEGLSGRAYRKTTLGRSPQPHIEFDARVDFAATDRLPSAPADRDHAERRRWRSSFCTDGNHKPARRRDGCGEGDRPRVRTFDFQERNRRAWIPPGDLSGNALAARQRHLDVTLFGKAFIRSDDKSWPPNKPRRLQAMGVNRNEAWRQI